MRLHLDEGKVEIPRGLDDNAAKNFKDGWHAGRIQGMQDQMDRQRRIEAERNQVTQPARGEYRGEPAGPVMGGHIPSQGTLRQGIPEAGGVKRKVAEILATSRYSADFHERVEKQLRGKAAAAERAMELIHKNPDVAELMDLLERLTK